MNRQIEKMIAYAKEQFAQDSSGHDFEHTRRVWYNAKQLQAAEGGDLFLIEAAALLHDVADEKLVENPQQATEQMKLFLLEIGASQGAIKSIEEIIDSVGFKGGNGKKAETIEAKIVQDADRLDAIGAIGIARTMLYSGAKGQALYDENIPLRKEMTAAQYRQMPSTTINHFYEKLLLLKDLMLTKTGKELAEKRHQFMETYLTEFFEETGYKNPND